MRLSLGLPVLLLALCAISVAQATPAPTPVPAVQQQAVAADIPEAGAGKAASAAPLSPEQQRLLDQADHLLDLAQQLKSEVEKTTQYTLSLNTLRRADDIEKLAKDLQKQIQRQDR
jgi:hypothetical protein